MGLLVVFEGVDGSGKSTQSRALKRRLAGAGYPTTLVHEPGGTPTGERIRRWVKGAPHVSPLAELFLFCAARASLVESVIRPVLSGAQVVLCDRYIYSSVAYQGGGRGLEIDVVDLMNQIATGGLLPDLVVLLDLPADQGLARKAAGASDRFEQEQLDFHKRVREEYLRMSRLDADRWLVLDSSASRSSLGDAVWARVSVLLESRGMQPEAPSAT